MGLSGTRFDRKREFECRTTPRHVDDSNCSTQGFHNATRNRKAYAETVTVRAEKGFGDLIKDIVRHTGTGVNHANGDGRANSF
jgi:hypothetical protein